MRRILIPVCLAAIFIFVISSCKKSSPASKYYISFKVNDTLITWKGHIFVLVGPDLTDTSQVSFSLNSTSSNSDTAYFIDLTIRGKSIPAITYDYSYTYNDTTLYTDYNLGNNDPNKPDYDIESVSGLPSPAFSMTITSLSKTEVKGTFTGNYLASYASGPPVIVSITNGEFYAPVTGF